MAKGENDGTLIQEIEVHSYDVDLGSRITRLID